MQHHRCSSELDAYLHILSCNMCPCLLLLQMLLAQCQSVYGTPLRRRGLLYRYSIHLSLYTLILTGLMLYFGGYSEL
jgi:hypothetical protein